MTDWNIEQSREFSKAALYEKFNFDLPATQHYDMKTLKGEVKPEAHVYMRVCMGGGGYQKSLIINILALKSIIDKAIFTKISIFQNVWA